MPIDEALALSLNVPTSGENLPQRLRLVEALKVQPPSDPSVLLFLRLLQDSEVLVQQLAVMGLKGRPDIVRHLLPDLVGLLEHQQERTRWAACEVLSELGTDAASALQKIQDFKPNELVARAIWKLSGRADSIIPLLIRLLDEEASAREQVCDLIYEIGPPASPAVPSLLRCLRGADADLKWAAVDALGAIGPKAGDAVPLLVQLLNNSSGIVAGRAAHALARIGPMSVPALIDALQSNETWTREFAADALSQLGESAKMAVPHLKKILGNERDTDRGSWAAIALARITRNNELGPILVEIQTRSSNDYLRQKAAEALQEL